MGFFTFIQYASDIPPNSQIILGSHHEWPLVILSYLLACLAAGIALVMVERVVLVESKNLKLFWVVLGGISMGGGIWAMHFIAMESFRAPIPVEYEVWKTFLSMLITIVFCSFALQYYSSNQSMHHTLIASVLLGTGIIFMHYIGMAAMIIPANVYYELPLFLASIAIAIGASLTALMISKLFISGHMKNSIIMRLSCSAVMGVAIAGMHFTAMAGTVLVAVDVSEIATHTVNVSAELSIGIASITCLILGLSIAASETHRRMQQNERHLNEVNQLVLQLKKVELSLQNVAYRDPVTNLDNRHSLNLALDKVIAHHASHHMTFTLLFIDVDNFKRVNDSLGHACGDQLLLGIAKRLTACLRPTDKIARFGGDEFVIILIEEFEFVEESITKRLLHVMERPFVLQNQVVPITLSIGVAQYPKHGRDTSEIVRNADIALYKAKDMGKNQYAIFDNNMHTQLSYRLQIENDLRLAIERDEIEVFYQPLVNAKDGSIVSFEALARWKRHGKMVSPMEFIRVAEENSLIIPLGSLVMKKALNDLARFFERGYSHLKLSVNLSPKQFQEKTLAENIEIQLIESNISGASLDVEITETGMINDIDLTVMQLNKLKELGVGISIDDFGTGYSSLSYLKKLPIDKLKIDRSFVMDLPDDKDDVAINEAVLAMAHKLRIEVIAEGIETREQSDFFAANNCEYLQGYLFSRPVAMPDAMHLLELDKQKALHRLGNVAGEYPFPPLSARSYGLSDSA